MSVADVTHCIACRKAMPEYVEVILGDEEGFEYRNCLEPPMCPECTKSQNDHYEWMEREQELERQHGGLSRCPSCDQFTVKKQDVCTLGYPGHPGAEFSTYSNCTNPDCNYAEI